MIAVSRLDWHARLYLWWYQKKYHRGRYGSTNLCPYMRAVIFWAPLRAIFWNWVTVFDLNLWDVSFDVPLNALTIPALFLALAKPLGYLSYRMKFMFSLFGVACLSAAVFISLMAVLGAYISHMRDTQMSDPNRWMNRVPPKPKIPKKPSKVAKAINAFTGWSFWTLLLEYLKSAHDNICPPVELRYPDSPSLPDIPPMDSSDIHEI